MKKIKKIIPMVLIFILCTSCSVNKQNKITEEFDTNDQFFSEANDGLTPAGSDISPESINALDTGHDKTVEVPLTAISAQVEKITTEAPVEIKKNESGIYEVKRGDTWMIISQKILGNPLKWRQIQKMNSEFKASSDLYVGAKLAYIVPDKQVVEPDGLPYLIKNADTLPKISKKVYGTKNSWDVIYYNNRDVIKSPDIIYSGFMIYYPEQQQVPMMKIEMAKVGFIAHRLRKPASVKNKN